MTQTPEDRSRPTPRPRPTPQARAARPSPRPRVAGSRREREEAPVAASTATGRRTAAREPAGTPAAEGDRRRFPALAALLAVLCLVAAAGVAWLTYERLNPRYVDPSVFSAARSAVEDLYAYDYQDSEGSVQRKLAVLTGDLREQYEAELGQGGIIETYEQVSATTSYEVLDVALQDVNDAQDTATVVVFGSYVAKSVTSGNGEAPEGSECSVTPEGAQSCVQTLRIRLLQVDGDWKISELTQLTTS
ncbi:hypothetical protein [Blastococcus sp. TF02A-30]|uniref:hypothetical protein n=1 Tax=Blastococcus sp. TF02A-30 TaxID=2250580 RepID=UPI000DE884BC|nr:hypothetical protein [Blastococcus sp. TF02A-30]RBY93110.1 hypothetical protein DQ241_03615 [Blastococcus sp. TF02A-30]